MVDQNVRALQVGPATPVTVNNTNVAITDTIIISLNTVGGTVGTQRSVKTITAATGFTVACTASDTSTINYAIIKNAAWLMQRDLYPAANDNSPAFMGKVPRCSCCGPTESRTGGRPRGISGRRVSASGIAP